MSYRIYCLAIATLLLLVQLAVCQWENAQLDTLTDNQVDDNTTSHSFVMSPDGTIHVTWYGEDNGGFTIYKYRAPGQDWSPDEFVMLGTEDQGRATLPKDVRPDSAWMVGQYGETLLFYERLFGGGWTHEDITPAGVQVATSDMAAAVDPSGRWHVVFVGDTGSFCDIYYAHYQNQSWEWQNLNVPLGQFGSGAAPELVVDDHGVAHVFCRVPAWNYVILHYWNDQFGGINWQVEELPNANMFNYTTKAIWSLQYGLCVAISGNEGFGMPGRIYYHQQPPPSSTWLPPELATDTHSAVNGQLALDTSGRPMIVWEETSGNFYTGNIYYAQKTVQWDNFPLFQDGISFSPQGLMDDQDNGYLLFSRDYYPDDEEIYFYGPEPQSNSPFVKSALLPETAILHPVYPNPLNASGTVNFTLPAAQLVQLRLFNALGQQVQTLTSGLYQPGQHRYTFDTAGLSSGWYSVMLETPNYTITQPVIILK